MPKTFRRPLTLAITAKANKLKESGVDIVSFAAGEPDFNTPEFIVNAAKDALDKGLTKYTPASGIAPLKKAVCAKLKRDNALDYQPEQIVISTGAKQSLFNTLQTVCQEGDEVIIISPYWLTYPELIKICGAKPVVVETKAEEGFALNVGLIEKAVTDKTRALILNMPNNPSGTVYGREKIEELAAMLRRHPDVWSCRGRNLRGAHLRRNGALFHRPNRRHEGQDNPHQRTQQVLRHDGVENRLRRKSRLCRKVYGRAAKPSNLQSQHDSAVCVGYRARRGRSLYQKYARRVRGATQRAVELFGRGAFD